MNALSEKNFFRIAIGLAVVVLFYKLYVAYTTFGSNDVLYFAYFYQVILKHGGVAVYHRIFFFNHPPFIVNFLLFLGWLSRLSHLSFPFLLRFFGCVADFLSLFCVYGILQHQKITFSRFSFLLMVLSPVAIMISGFHGNTDSILIFFVLLSIYLLQKSDRLLFLILAGMALGMATNIKVVPLILFPVFFFSIKTFRRQFIFFFAALIVILIGSIPYLYQDPIYIIHRVLYYNSLPGHWGLTHLMLLVHSVSLLSGVWCFLKYFIVVLVLVLSFWMNKKLEKPAPLFVQCGFILFLFMSIASGFSLQYLVWLVPFIVLLSSLSALLFQLTSGVFLFSVYTYWSQSFPWFFANSDKVGDWVGPLKLCEIIAWLVICLCCYIIGARIFKQGK